MTIDPLGAEKAPEEATRTDLPRRMRLGEARSAPWKAELLHGRP
jgi:hypothetical protein